MNIAGRDADDESRDTAFVQMYFPAICSTELYGAEMIRYLLPIESIGREVLFLFLLLFSGDLYFLLPKIPYNF